MTAPSGPGGLSQDPDSPDNRITRDQILRALERAVAVVPPGHVLAVRVPGWLAPSQVAGYQRTIDGLLRHHGLPVDVLILPGEEFAVIRPDDSGLTRPLRATGHENGHAPTEAMRRIEGTGPGEVLP